MTPNQEKLRQLAHELALTDDSRKSQRPSKLFLHEFHHDVGQISRFVYDLQDYGALCSQPAEEWLLDHAGFLLEQSLVVRDQLGPHLLKRLPELRKQRVPRLLPICNAYISQSDGELNEDSLVSYIRHYQEVTSLTLAEVWALPLFMRIALMSRLAHIVEHVRERHEACKFVERLLATWKRGQADPAAINAALEETGQEMPLSGAMIVHLIGHLREWGEDSVGVREWLRCRLENGNEGLDQIQSYEFQLQAAYQLETGNIIGSLRKLERWNWQGIFGRISVVEQTLLEEESGIYARLDATSRDLLRKHIESLARRFRVPESRVAEQAVELAGQQRLQGLREPEGDPAEANGKTNEMPRRGFVAYYLLDAAGIKRLKHALSGCGETDRTAGSGLSGQQASSYFTPLILLFAVALGVFAWWMGYGMAYSAAEWTVVIGLLLLPASEWGVTAAHWLIECRKKPLPLLRYEYSHGIPDDAATMVIVPVIWSSAEEVDELAARLELHYLANRDPNLRFALLGDYCDATEERLPGDAPLVAAAIDRIRELNTKYPGSDGGSRFYLFQRRRLWNLSEEVWMGWERKRGKLVEFVELLRGREDTTFDIRIGEASVFPKIRYLITLDADTQLPPESAKRMIAALHLPYNRPRLNASRTRVIEGYGVLQPRIATSYDGATQTRLTSLWSGAPGVDPYAFAVSDPYQDGLGEGIFTGKGIFDVDVFAEVICERIPENHVLSHDLLESGFLRAGLLTDVVLMDELPAKFHTFQKRLHRWVRGDWQLLVWLFPQAYDRRGTLSPVDMAPITRWQIIDNLRRSLLMPALFVLLGLSLTVLPGHAGRWLILALATLLLPLIRFCLTLKQIWANPRSLGIVAGQVLVQLAVLPYQTVLLLDAIGRTLFRLWVSKRHLLEWVSSAEVDRSARSGKHPVLQGMRGGYALLVLVALAAVSQQAPGPKWTGLVLVAYWALAPVWITWLNKPPRTRDEALTETERNELGQLAAQTWRFFEEHVTEEDHWLPPDNVQIDPPNGTAHRTSPTNIGLYMASVLAARDFGYIDTPGLILRLDRTLATVERLETWHGHLFNWIHTATLETLTPKYVSSVDSGNFICSLIAVKEGLEEWLDRDGLQAGEELARGRQLIGRIEDWVGRTDFVPLYDSETKLFSLGYDASRMRMDPVVYDLMASESRQTSFIAIALGQIPVDHWYRLGRTLTRFGKRLAYLSWSGTMFEFLMPFLFMRTYRNTVWNETCLAVVNRQIEYARQMKVPFGISESGYYAFDYQLNYQYRAFGVPGLGFQRGLDKDLVIAPYASIMALPFAPKAGLANLRRLEQLGARGAYGYFEAVDFTVERLPKTEPFQVIRSFMAHHQGMSLLTLANVLLETGMTDRFHRDKRVQAVELLLQERIPSRPRVIRHPDRNAMPAKGKDPLEKASSFREIHLADGPTPVPEIGVLSNGSLTTVVTDSGSGYIRFGDTALTRWSADALQDETGSFIYIRDVTGDSVWSPGFQPCRVRSSKQRVRYELDRVTFTREDDDIVTCLEIGVTPDSNADIRRLTLTNAGSVAKVLEVTTYSELVLASPIADDAHPAFSKLFVETAIEEEAGCLLARRRPRHDGEQPLWAAHALMTAHPTLGSAEFETDRSEFVGRGYARSSPKGLRAPLRGTFGAVTDPVFVMRLRLSVEPGERLQLFAVTSVGYSKEEVLGAVGRFADNASIERSFQLAWTFNQIELRHLRLTADEADEYQRMAGRLLVRAPLGNEQGKYVQDNRKGQSGLWPYGISGDRPVLLVHIADRVHMPFIAKVLTGYEYLRRLGIRFDLVLLNESAGGYQQDLQDALHRAVEFGVSHRGGSGGVFVFNSRNLPANDITLLVASAHLVLHAEGRSLKAQIRVAGTPEALPEPFVPSQPSAMSGSSETVANGVADAAIDTATDRVPAAVTDDSLMFNNGWGGFAPDGSEYRLRLQNADPLPAPWINVMANPGFGCFVSEQGTGYTWWRNSRECKLTPWSNDPVLDQPGEIGYWRDEESGEAWTLFPWGAPPEQGYAVEHGKGYTRFRHERYGVLHEATVFVASEDPVKIIEIRVINRTPAKRSLSFTYYAEWVLGVRRETNAPFIVSEWDAASRTLQAHNTYQEHFKGATAFLGVFPPAATSTVTDQAAAQASSWTGDRREFIGREGTLARPAALERASLSDRTGAFGDSCGAIQVHVSLEPNAEQVLYVVLGCEDSREGAANLASAYRDPGKCREAFRQAGGFWQDVTEQIVVSTPSPEMDLLLNGWLLYQSLSCRMWARTAFYQAGGAYGYRDQLQDSLSLLHVRPDLTRKQLLTHAAHQYEEGDVQHWWHEETGYGIRTRFSDDYLWLPYAISRYIEHTEDAGILDEQIAYLRSEPLGAEEHERYEPTRISSAGGSLYEHGVRAIDFALRRMGEHGLPLIGIGDWNDGMSRLGAEGRGESVWLAWFLCDVLGRFAEICENRGNAERAEGYRQSKQRLALAADEHGWDGQWYRRAFTDQGDWIGSVQAKECRIDAIAQSWSVLSGAAPDDKARQAMGSFDRELVDRALSVARLLDPPFDSSSPSPGYIQGYPPGIRENGGQYTHGVIWSIIAWCQLGHGEKAVELFQLLNPVTHTKTPQDVLRYAGEPYAMAADVYTAVPHEGRAGWTWYTGAAGWMYQAGVEWILGLRRKGARLYILPCIPDEWPGFAARYRYGSAIFAIAVRNGKYDSLEPIQESETPQAAESVKLDADGMAYVDLLDDGQRHEIEWTIR